MSSIETKSHGSMSNLIATQGSAQKREQNESNDSISTRGMYLDESLVVLHSMATVRLGVPAITSGQGCLIEPDPAARIAAQPASQNKETRSLSPRVPFAFLSFIVCENGNETFL